MFDLLANIETPKTILDWITQGGIVGLLVFILFSGQRRWWVFGWQYKELETRCNKIEESNTRWMEMALRGVNVTERIVRVVDGNDSTKA